MHGEATQPPKRQLTLPLHLEFHLAEEDQRLRLAVGRRERGVPGRGRNGRSAAPPSAVRCV